MSIVTERRLGWITLNGQRFPNRKPADWQQAVEQQMCPFCGEGPFVVVAMHVARKHALDRNEFRDLLGVSRGASICDPTYSRIVSQHSSEMFAQGRSGISGEGLRHWRESEECAEARRRAAEASHAEDRSRWPEVQRLIAEGLSYDEVSERTGLHARTIGRIARKTGSVEEDGRARFHRQHRDSSNAILKSARDAFSDRAATRGRSLVDEWAGGTSIEVLAQREAVSRASMVALLRKYGAEVPDLRTVKPVEMFVFDCPVCGTLASRPAAQVRANRKQGWDGPFCGMSCAGKFRQAKRSGRTAVAS